MTLIGTCGSVDVLFDYPRDYYFRWHGSRTTPFDHAEDLPVVSGDPDHYVRGQFSTYRREGWDLDDVTQAYELALAHHNLIS